MPRTTDKARVAGLKTWHGFKDPHFPAINELESCIKSWVIEICRRKWPEDDWIVLDNFEISLWIEDNVCRATVYPRGNYMRGIGLFFGPIANWSGR